VSYHVQCHQAEGEQVTQVWQISSPFGTEDLAETQGAQFVEHKDTFKLQSAGKIPVISCEPEDDLEDNILGEITETEQIEYKHADEKLFTSNYPRVTEICIFVKNCPAKSEKKDMKFPTLEIRPLTRLYIQPLVPPTPASYRKYALPEKAERLSIKFSTCTALYTPAKPGYAGGRYRESEGASSARSNLSGRARSEFRERSVGRKRYVSLYH
jgi:hypothetical protein